MDKFETVYVSSACNRTPHCVDWGRNKLICYGASNSVALYDPKYADAGKVVCVLCQHKGRVNCVRWIKHNDGSPETELVSVSSDCTAVVWTRTESCNFLATSILKGHKNIVTVADGIYLPRGHVGSGKQAVLVATASVDSTVKIWIRRENEDDFVCVQTLGFGTGFCLSIRLCILPGTNSVLLACGADDAKIHLFAESVTEDKSSDTEENSRPKQFVKVDSLVGHEDWIRAIDIALDDSGHLLLASSSQDSLIRLWRITPSDEHVATRMRKPICELTLAEDIQPEEKFFNIRVQDDAFPVRYFAVSLESVLAGHEGWVYGIDWHPSVYSEEKQTYTQPMKLLSSSLDKTIIIWEPDPSSGVWLESVRVGEVGGNTLGFYGSKFGPDGLSIMGHGYLGSFHLWSYSEELSSWEPGVTVGGHYGEVMDMQWEPGGQFLLSVSTDQTTRIHAPWIRDGHHKVTWHELARPQVHGYDMACLAVLSRYRFASGAEEKVIRAFQAPSNFVKNFHHICKIESDKDIESSKALSIPEGASVPALGLSNKAVYDSEELPREERHVKDEYPEFYFTPIDLKEPPAEENLLQNTLWPEVHKLYGHGYELFALAARHDGTLLASACKATTAEHAAVILWDTSTWKQTQQLVSHQLTVTQMAFSPDDQFLLSVSRDRRWSLFQLDNNELGSKSYTLVASTDKKTGVHTRIIWTCCWTHDSKHFLTGSRDGKVVVWGHSRSPSETGSALGQYGVISKPLELSNQSVTALAVAPMKVSSDEYLIAIGLESGYIHLYKWSSAAGETEENWKKCVELDNSAGHHLTVKKLMFRPLVAVRSGCDSDIPDVLQLASCASDHAVKIYNIHINKL
ncbi:elongator complex protein 2 [Periplaneta americana]|uniref:elongator complex protein 2 n=1 Tax=Periplaneta americana TaxID=6978 RepID=UPI0037E95369